LIDIIKISRYFSYFHYKGKVLVFTNDEQNVTSSFLNRCECDFRPTLILILLSRARRSERKARLFWHLRWLTFSWLTSYVLTLCLLCTLKYEINHPPPKQKKKILLSYWFDSTSECATYRS